MTDITELAQREKFEAWFVNDVVEVDINFPAFKDGEYAEGEIYDEQLYFMLQAMWRAWKAANAERVEALEKSEKTSEARREAIDRAHNMFVRERDRANAAEEALEKAQQQTTESENRVRKQNRHICELFDDNTALRQRIAELESRTVSVKLLTPEVRNALKAEGLADVLKDAAEYAPLTAGQWETLTKNWYQTFIGLSGSAAGIKVEAE